MSNWRDDETPRMKWYRDQRAKGVSLTELMQGPTLRERIKMWWNNR